MTSPSRSTRVPNGSCELRTRVDERTAARQLLAAVGRVELAARVRDEQVGPSVGAEIRGRDPHAGVRVVDARSPRHLFEAEAEAATGLRDVAVELVRIGVVRDVQIDASVAVDIGEDRPEAVAEPIGLQPHEFPTSRNVARPLSPRPSLR